MTEMRATEKTCAAPPRPSPTLRSAWPREGSCAEDPSFRRPPSRRRRPRPSPSPRARVRPTTTEALAARERRTVRALAQVRAQLRALGPRELAVELFREGELCLGARERALELFPQRAPSAEDERLDRAHRDAEHLGDLGVRASLDLAEHDRCALVEREVAERAPDVLCSRR